jgi:signal transduction histidine kinase
VVAWAPVATIIVIGLLESQLTEAITERAGTAIFCVLVALPLAFRHRWPLRSLGAAYLIGAGSLWLLGNADDFSTPFLVVLFGAYTAGGLAVNRDALAGLAMTWTLVAIVALSADRVIVGDFLFPMGFSLFAWTVGRAIRHRTLLAAELHEAALSAEEAREEDTARAIADERRRIAREMHDLVGHSVSVMVVQAGGARRILDRDPERAAEAAELIEQTGRAALAEMRRLLGLLGPGETGAFAPQPTLDGLDALIGRARGAGLPVTATVEGEPRDLPAGAELAAYRIVQEALTNVIKHGGRAHTDVVVRWAGDALELAVTDYGGRAIAGAGDELGAGSLGGSGQGLIGMRERTRVYGGDLEAAPRTGGGFAVHARIPYEQSEVRAA